MPCTDGGPSLEESYDELSKKFKRREAMLCLTFRLFQLDDDEVKFDQKLKKEIEKECGVTYKQLMAWWTKHKVEDVNRKRQEALEKKEEKERKAALAKLSKKERHILGIR